MHAFVQHHLDFAPERRLDRGHPDLAVALHRMTVADRNQRAWGVDG